MVGIAGPLRRALLIGITLIACFAAAALVIAQTEWFKIRLTRYIVREASWYLNGTVSIGRLEGNLMSGIELKDVGLSIDGSEVVAVGDLALSYNVLELISKGASIDRIRIDKPVVHVMRDGNGWSIARLLQKSDATRSSRPRPVAIRAIDITNGSVAVDDSVGTGGVSMPRRLDDVDASVAFSYEPDRFFVTISRLSFHSSEPTVSLEELTGSLAVRDNDIRVDNLAIRTRGSSLSVDGALLRNAAVPRVQLEVRSDRLSVPEIAEIVPSLAGISLAPALELSLNGPANRLAIDARVRSPAGLATANLVSDVVSPRRTVAGSVGIRHLNMAPILDANRLASDVTADVRLDLESTSYTDMAAWSGSVQVDAPHVAAAGYKVEAIHARAAIERGRVATTGTAETYGAKVDANGRLSIAERDRSLAFDVGGHLRGLDLRRLPD